MADVSAYWVGDVVVARSVLTEPGVPLVDLLGRRAAASVDNMFGRLPVDGWRVIDGALPADPAVDVAPVIIAAPWQHPGANGWMVVSVVRHAGRWQAMHIMDRRPLVPYVSPSERWPSASELFGPIWRLRDLRPAGGDASLPTTSVGLCTKSASQFAVMPAPSTAPHCRLARRETSRSVLPGRGSGLCLDEDHEGFGQHAVVGHRLGRPLGLHRAHESVHVRNVHEHSNMSPVLRVDERPNVGDTEGPEELFALRRGEPMICVLHIVVTDYGRHSSPWASWADGGCRARRAGPYTYVPRDISRARQGPQCRMMREAPAFVSAYRRSFDA